MALDDKEFILKLQQQIRDGAPSADTLTGRYCVVSPEGAAVALAREVLEAERSADYSRVFFG